MRTRLAATVVLAGSLLGGCLSSILPEPAPAPSIYRLSSPAPSGLKNTGATVVRVENPSSARTYNTRDILVVTYDGTLSQAAGAQWSDTIPQILQDALLTQLGQSPEYIAVIPVSGARADIRVHLDVREFAAIYDQGPDGAPLADVQLYATVADAGTRNFIGTFSAKGTARATDNRVSAIVRAQSAATIEALDQLVQWMNGLDVTPSIDAVTGVRVKAPAPPG